MGILDKKKVARRIVLISFRRRFISIAVIKTYTCCSCVRPSRSLIPFPIQQYCTIHDPTPNFSAAIARSRGLLHRDSEKNEDRNCSSRRRLRSWALLVIRRNTVTPWYFPNVLPSRAFSLMMPYLFAPRKASDIVGYLWPKFTFYAQTSAESY